MADSNKKKKNDTSARRAPVVASLVALSLVIIKVGVGVYSGAVVLIASAVDSGLDFLVSVFNYFAIRYAEKPSDETFNYGRGKLKAIASVFEGLLIVASALFIIVTAILKIQTEGEIQHTSAAVIVMIISTLMTAALVVYLGRTAKRTGDLVVKTDALHYKVDLWSNLGILVVLLVISQVKLFILDPIISIGIAIYIVYEAVKLIHEGFLMLMDRALDSDLVDRIVEILEENEHVTSYHLLRTRRSAHINYMDVDLVFYRHISLWEAHKASEKIEKKIRDLTQDEWVINCHLDPVDDLKKDLIIHPDGKGLIKKEN